MPGPKRNLDLYEAIGMNPNMNKFYKEIYEEYGITVGLFSREISVSEGTARASISNSLRSKVKYFSKSYISSDLISQDAHDS